MKSRTMAGIGVVLWLAAAPLAMSAENDKAEAKATPATGEAKAAPPAAEAKAAPPAAGAKGVKAAGPRLQMAEHRGKNPGKDRDMRHCLDLPSNKEIIRCSEQK
ncbi:MAG TPA: hypothetical protein VLS49_05010 [Usitatibacter sp.]|nr:hypothetical protein [Usitatibacter sp.]